MSDNNSSFHEKKKDEKVTDPQNMSLAELLGSYEETSEPAPSRVDHIEDELDSGVLRLADMIASSSVEQAKTPSLVPPIVIDSEQAETAPTPSGITTPVSSPIVAGAAVGAPSKKQVKSSTPIYVLITVVIVSAASIIYFLNQKEEAAKDEAVKEEPVEKDNSNEEASNKETEEKDTVLEGAGEEEGEPHSISKNSKRRGRKSHFRRSSLKKKTAKKTETAEERSSAPVEKTSTSNVKPIAENDGVPRIPSKADVRTAMGPVTGKAQTCAKYSTGIVQLRVTVGNNGSVLKSKAMGSFANTTAGKCVEMLAGTARFSSFKDPSFTFTYPIILR